MSNDSDIDMFIVDVLRHDIEQVSSITKILNDSGCIGWREFWPHDFAIEEVVSSLNRLMRRSFVQQLIYDREKGVLIPTSTINDIVSSEEEYWFELTAHGNAAWEKWKPPTTSN